MTHPRSSDPDKISVSYKSLSRRSTRLLLLEMAVEAYKSMHPVGCCCLGCSRTEAAMKIKEATR